MKKIIAVVIMATFLFALVGGTAASIKNSSPELSLFGAIGTTILLYIFLAAIARLIIWAIETILSQS